MQANDIRSLQVKLSQSSHNSLMHLAHTDGLVSVSHATARLRRRWRRAHEK